MTAYVVLAGLAFVIGIVFLSNATMGVGAIAAGCFFGIFARIAQADRQHRAVLKALAQKPVE